MKFDPAAAFARLRAVKGPRGVVLVALLGLGVLLVAGMLLLALAMAWYATDLPALDKATNYRPQQHLRILTADGVEIAQFGSERRIFVPITSTPKTLRDAVLATEDAQFYEHGGISFRGLVRATLANLTGGMPQGASTITQQVARTFFLSTRRTPERKIKEAMLAVQLERRLDKDHILELYLNQIYLGQRSYGFGAAAQRYFGKALDQLTLGETAMLAGLPQNPIYANPIANLDRATKRQLWVLGRMVKTGAITEAQATTAIAEKLVLRNLERVDVNAEHVAEMARRAVVERLGDKAYTEGVRVFTSLRADDQRAAYAALRKAVIAHERKQPWRGPEDFEKLPDDDEAAERAAALALKDQRDDEDLRIAIVLQAGPREVTLKLTSGDHVAVKGDNLRWVANALSPKSKAELAIRRGAIVRVMEVKRGKSSDWALVQWPQADAAFVALDPVTARVRALVGGFEFGKQPFNHVTHAMRQPGSSFKPFLYSAAFENHIQPETLVEDAPLTNADGSEPSWNPRNSDGRFDGDITVREGLVRSKNLVSVRLLQQIGLPAAREWIARFGFDMSKQPQDLTLALGTGSVSPLQMAQAYAVFANGGYRMGSPVLIERIVGAQGEVLFEAPPAMPLDEDIRVIPARNVFLVDSLLADVTRRGTAARAQATLQRPDLYGKTGTTNDAVDAWFAGFAPGVVGVAWIGYDDPESLGEGESGGGLALPIWIESMARMLKGVAVKPLTPPEGVVEFNGDWRYADAELTGITNRVGTLPFEGTAAAPPVSTAPPTAPASEPNR